MMMESNTAERLWEEKESEALGHILTASALSGKDGP
jgi:hypothetical protein